METAARPDPKADFHKGLALLLAGEAFDAHEVWEELWLEAGGARARYLQGLIQLAVALYHWQCGRHAVARRLQARGESKLTLAKDGPRLGEPSAQQWLQWASDCFAPLHLQKETGEPQAPPPSSIPVIPEAL